MNKLRQMSIFAHVVENGSISRAADNLGLSKSVISQHLKALEQELGMSLLKRTTRQQSLTPAGEQFYRHCQQLNQLADTAWNQAQQSANSLAGKLRITAPNALMDSLIAPVISQLIVDNPEFEPELISSDQKLNLHAEHIDLAIRVGGSGDSNLKQQALGQFRDVLCLSKSQSKNKRELPYLANTWEGKNIDYQLSHKSKSQSKRFQARARCQSNALHTNLALVKAGAGIACLPEFIFAQQQDLQLLFRDYQLPLNTIYALHPYRDFMPANAALTIGAIKQALQKL